MQVDSPGVSSVLQQQAADPSMSQRVPVDAVRHSVLQAETEVEVQVQDVQPVGVCEATAVEVGFDDVITQCVAQVTHLLEFHDGNR